MTTYLVLTRPDNTDADLWTTTEWEAIAITGNDDVQVHANIATMPDTLVKIVILNMTNDCFRDPNPNDRTLLFAKLHTILGDTPRIWIHFGGDINTFCEVGTLLADADKPYPYFTAAFPQSIKMPYSQTTNAAWDAALKRPGGLTGKVQTAIDRNTQLQMGIIWRELEDAWAAVTKKMQPAKVEESRQASSSRDALKAFLAVAIYCDGLAYANQHAEAKVPDMRKEIVRDVPEIIANANWDGATDGSLKAVVEKAQALATAAKSSKNGDSALITAADAFLKAYKTAQA